MYKYKYKLPPELRDELRIPLGKIVGEKELEELAPPIISVGDMATLTLKNRGIIPDVLIVDFKTKREKFTKKREIEEIGEMKLTARNLRGTISNELWDAVKRAYEIAKSKKVRIEVDGEEDLATLPAILMAPKKANVIYGLPSVGIVLVKVDDRKREIVRQFLDKMEEENGN